MKTIEVETIGPDELAARLRVSKSLIYKAVSGRSSLSLPPRIILPGSRRLIWLLEDVLEFLRVHREQIPQSVSPVKPAPATRRRGRPRKEEVIERARGAA